MSDEPNEAPDTAGGVAPPGSGQKPCSRPPSHRARSRGWSVRHCSAPGCSCSSPVSVQCAGCAPRKAGKPTSSLVVEVPYRFTRYPIYLGFTLCYVKAPSSPTRSRPPCCSPSSSASYSAGQPNARSATWSSTSARSTCGTRQASGAGSKSRYAFEAEVPAAVRVVPAESSPLRSGMANLRRGTGHRPHHRRCCQTALWAHTRVERS